jgi:hypothetical protein
VNWSAQLSSPYSKVIGTLAHIPQVSVLGIMLGFFLGERTVVRNSVADSLRTASTPNSVSGMAKSVAPQSKQAKDSGKSQT